MGWRNWRPASESPFSYQLEWQVGKPLLLRELGRSSIGAKPSRLAIRLTPNRPLPRGWIAALLQYSPPFFNWILPDFRIPEPKNIIFPRLNIQFVN